MPPELRSKLGRAQIEIVNFHVFKRRETLKAPKVTRQILGQGAESVGVFTETPDQMVRRAVGSLARKRNLVVLNDEAHHCYRRKPDATDELVAKELKVLKGEDRQEAEQRDRDARVWLSGLEAVAVKLGVRGVYDLSATPFFLRGSGYQEGSLFPWVVSDFGLIDAIEAGLVKIPRVPVDDDTLQPNDLPTYRTLWMRIRDKLPRKGDKIDEPSLPVELEGALLSLYGNYERSFNAWRAATTDDPDATPPVFIVVCNNTTVSKMVFDWVAGYNRTIPGQSGPAAVSGHLELFSNVVDGRWTSRPSSILVDSMQLESDDAMSDEFKRAAAAEIDVFKAEYRARFPGRDVDALSDSDLLREVMNTVGKPGRLGEHVRCVVSVSMLTEGWDANSVTHVLGVRAFGTQLLCEQVVGRGLRRMSYVTDPDSGHFLPEYAEVYGIPFTFMPASDVPKDHQYRRATTGKRVWAQPDRGHCRITFPRVVGYRYEIGDQNLAAEFDAESRLVLSNADLPTYTEVEGITGAQEVHTLDDLRTVRRSSVAFKLADELVLRFRDDPDDNGVRGIRPWLFPRLLSIVRDWMGDPRQLVLTDGVFAQLLMIGALREQAVERIYNAIVSTPGPEPRLSAILREVEAVGSTDEVDFMTAKTLWPTKAGEGTKCHVNAVTLDSRWEQTVAQRLEQMPAVKAYVKNQGMGFEIPYAIEGKQHRYMPDFVARIDDGHGPGDLLNLLIEVTGMRGRPKEAKVDTARDLWCPAVTNLGSFGRWKLVEVTDPANVISELTPLTGAR